MKAPISITKEERGFWTEAKRLLRQYEKEVKDWQLSGMIEQMREVDCSDADVLAEYDAFDWYWK